MTKYVISYDLNKADKNYDGLISKIKTYNNIKAIKSMWFIKTNDSSESIYNKLKLEIDNNDYLFIGEINNNCYGWLSKDVWTFLNS